MLTLARQPINGLDQAALDSLGEAITVVERDDQVRALVIASSIEGVFCSGGDLAYWSQITDGHHVGHAGRSLFARIEALGKPVIGAINGHTVGDGIGLALACDLRIASERAKFRLPELAYGFIPGWGTLGRLIRAIGRPRTAQLLLTGRPMDANEAMAVGLVNEVVVGDELLETAVARAAAIGRAPASAVQAAKAALRSEDEADWFEAVWGSDDWREGMAAAKTRRPAVFAYREGGAHMLSLEDFKRIDLRVGQVISAEPIHDAQRLLKVTVDLGNERRTLVGSLAQSYSPEQLVGVQVIVMINLAPATIKGVISQGMMLGVGCEEPGAVSLLTVHRPVRNGTPVQ